MTGVVAGPVVDRAGLAAETGSDGSAVVIDLNSGATLGTINLPTGNAAPNASGVVVWAGRKADDPANVAAARNAMLADTEDQWEKTAREHSASSIGHRHIELVHKPMQIA